MQNEDLVKGKYLVSVVSTETYYFLNLIYKVDNNKIYPLENKTILENNNNLKIVVSGDERYFIDTKKILQDNSILLLNMPEISNKDFFKQDMQYDSYSPKSAKYFTYISNLNRRLSKIDDNNIYQIVDCDNIISDFKKFKHEKEYRRIKSIDLPELITNKIYIKYNGYLYGYFTYKEEDEFIEIDNASSTGSNKNKLKIEDVQDSIIELDDEYYNFIGDLIYLESVNIKENEDFIYIDDLIPRVMNEIRRSSTTNMKLTKSELNDLKSELKEVNTIDDYRKNLFEELIDGQINFFDIKDDLIDNILLDKEKLDTICKEIADKYYYYGEVSKIIESYSTKIKDKKSELEKIKNNINHEIEELARLKNDRSKELEIKNTDKLNKLKKDIENSTQQLEKIKEDINLKKNELDELNRKHDLYMGAVDIDIVRNNLEEKKKNAEEELRKVKEKLEEYSNEESRHYNNLLKKAVKDIKESYENSSFNSFASNNILKISSEYENQIHIENLKNNINNQENYNNLKYENEKEIVRTIQQFILEKAHRNIKFNDVANIIICIAQGFLTVFAGEPGTGKTSLCNILGKAMGLNKEEDGRYIEISVEKGWTSKSDFIGYFNPLSKEFDSNNKNLYDAFLKLDLEEKIAKNYENFKQFPYIILLDEANLSPMEHYWADFMNVCDLGLKQEHYINLGEGNVYEISNSLRFLATINYDHTTEVLSPRLIDRAWIILLEYQNEIKINDLIDSIVNNNDYMLDFNGLKLFMNNENKSMPKAIEKRLIDIVQLFRENNISISPRVLKMIKNYCAIGDNIFEKETVFTTLDYAVSQKILPLINGYGNSYKKFLENLLEYQLKGMNRCQKIIISILDRGDKNMGHYSFFSR